VYVAYRYAAGVATALANVALGDAASWALSQHVGGSTPSHAGRSPRQPERDLAGVCPWGKS